MRRAYDGISPKPPLNLQLLRRTHVHKGKIAIAIHHQILGLKIPIDDSIIMHVLHHKQNLPYQEPSVVGSKGNHLSDDIKQVLPLDELHHEVYEVRVLDQLVEINDEGMPGHRPQDLLLVHDVLDYLGFLHIGPVQDLNRVHLLSLVIPARIHLTKITLPQPAHYMKVSNLHLLLQSSLVLLQPLLSPPQLLTAPLLVTLGYHRELHPYQHPVLLGYQVLHQLRGLLLDQLQLLHDAIGCHCQPPGALHGLVVVLTPPQNRVQHHHDSPIEIVSLLQHDLSLLEGMKHCTI